MRHGITRIAVLLGICTLFSGCMSSLVYHPRKELARSPADAGLSYEWVNIEASDGVKITGWWVPAADARGSVLFCHGNGGNIADRLDTLVIGNRLKLSMLIFDYRGYGRSEGSPSEQGTYADAEAAYRYLTQERGIAPETVILWGRSLGGPIAARTAAEHPCGALIIESSFTSLGDLVRDRFGMIPSLLLWRYAYPTRSHLEHVGVPVLAIHSADDEMIPLEHGKELYRSIQGRKSFLEISGSHNRGFIDSLAVYGPAIDGFVDEFLVRKEAVSP
ncbi:MAG: alpha/beta hydrolase [Desulfomonilia bacterium]|jgi:pimeloyl-ACP methyl ester carboxylesterase|nr:alpha/beta hydrolase [Deltaproteobacteria bacterium]